MKFREFMNTCSASWEQVLVYFDEDDWKNYDGPFMHIKDMRKIGMNNGYILDRTVDAWDFDANFNLYVLLSEV